MVPSKSKIYPFDNVFPAYSFHYSVMLIFTITYVISLIIILIELNQILVWLKYHLISNAVLSNFLSSFKFQILLKSNYFHAYFSPLPKKSKNPHEFLCLKFIWISSSPPIY